MSANNDNAMTRFLFAILKQKNLKDIDWNKVAHDPILSQPITNGHAARMRYSRFRSAMLGLEPTRRNRTGPPKSKVTKSKKDTRTRREDSVRPGSSAAASPADSAPEPPQPAPHRIKQENAHYGYNSRLTPALTPGPVSGAPTSAANPALLQNRFLTPCSDTDPFPPSPAMAPSPASEMIHSQGPFGFHSTAYHDHHVDAAWAPGTSYFAAAYPFDEYSPIPCGHQQYHHTPHPQEHMSMANQSIEAEPERVYVKREDMNRHG
ncbi:hypothetical protein GGS20DRAFT_596150 [Poronia punctata]|nr:hypothetical protein GGS20DRAFT_596150 [Poronia punctata]